MAQRSFGRRWFYFAVKQTLRVLAVVFFQIRCFGREHAPQEGSALVCANHQSFFDPLLVGLACDRRMNFLARKSLFHFALFGQLISYLDAIPIEREGLGLAGIKETLRRLKRGEMVLVFPEGTRTADGRVQQLKPGVCALARRARAPLVPVAVDGAFDAWPRHARLPRAARIHVQFGQPMSPQLVASLNDEQLMAELQRRIAICHAVAQARHRRSQQVERTSAALTPASR